MIAELLALFGASPDDTISDGYVDLEARRLQPPAVVYTAFAMSTVVRPIVVLVAALISTQAAPPRGEPSAERPFGTLREQAAMQQDWLTKRLDTFLPALMRKHGIDMWVVPMREYNEDPVFTRDDLSRDVRRATPDDLRVLRQVRGGRHRRRRLRASSGSRLAARRRAASSTRARSTKAPSATSVSGQQAELWGDEQWQALKAGGRGAQAEGDRHRSIDGLRLLRRPVERRAAGHERGARRANGRRGSATPKRLPLELIASRLPEEEVFYRRMQELVWQLTQTMFSEQVIMPGKTRTSDLVWWWRQRVNDLGLGTWFQPSVEVQRKGVTAEAARRRSGHSARDVLHCDVGITVARLNTDTQHDAYVLQPGETDAPAGLQRGARERERAAGHRDGRDPARAGPATRFSPPRARA